MTAVSGGFEEKDQLQGDDDDEVDSGKGGMMSGSKIKPKVCKGDGDDSRDDDDDDCELPILPIVV